MSPARLSLVAGLIALCAGAGAGAADDADFVHALRVPADSTQLRALAAGWQGRWAELRAAILGSDPQRRRGAARLAARAGVPPVELLAALVATRDADAQRLGLAGLGVGLDTLPSADLLALADPDLVCTLLARQAQDPFATPAVATQIFAWLLQPATCLPAAELCCARGTATRCGQALIAALAVADETVVGTAHEALCVLTRTQRSRGVYAGHAKLLAKDWSDVLAAAPPARSDASPDLVALVADLPAPAALVELLGKGPAALAAVEQALEGAEKARRRELAVAARLLARDVSPTLWSRLGGEGLDGMDAALPRDRLKAMTRAAEAVREAKDAPGLLHLLSYTDDRDAGVRTAAFDRLVRLADQRQTFTSEWRLSDGGLFPPGRTLHRLRRALATGSADEQIAALRFIAGLDADEVGDDVAALLLSPVPVVVDTVLETLGHLGLEGRQPALLRLAQDGSQPPARRVQVIGMLAKSGSRHFSESKPSDGHDQVLLTLERIAAGQPPTVAMAARKAWVTLGKDHTRRLAALIDMLANPAQRADALTLIRDEFATDHQGPPVLGALAVPHLRDPDPALAAIAAESLCQSFDEPKLRAQVPGWFDADARAHLAANPEQAAGQLLALAIRLDLVPRERALVIARALPSAGVAAVAHALLVHPDPLVGLGDLAALMGGHQLEGGLAYAALRAAKLDLLLQLTLLDEIAAAGATDLVPHDSSDSDHADDKRTETLVLNDGRKLIFTGARKPGTENNYDDDSWTWTLAHAPEPLTTLERTLALGAALDVLSLSSEASAERDLLLAVALRRPLPVAADVTVDHDANAWNVLAARDPALRARLVARLVAHPPDSWQLGRFLRQGEADLLPVAMTALTTEREKYRVASLITYLASLPPAAVIPHLPVLLVNPAVARDARLAPLLTVGPLPIACLLPLAAAHPGAAVEFTAYTQLEAEALAAGLAAFSDETVLAAANLMRQARKAAPTSFDPILRRLVERGDAKAAAWLRTGLPLTAGMGELYDRALESSDADVWLVGAAKALKEGRLPVHDFVARVAAMPPPAQAKAVLVAARYLGGGKLDGEVEGLARILATCPAKSLSAWIALLPADPAIGAALAARARDPGTAGMIGFALDARLRADRAHWQPLLAETIAAAKGRLDYLKPR